jgi:glycosyltransferase involved in cell wall biosynthesis
MILHVACLPFPSHQGTQAAIAAMLEASVASGRQSELLVYARGGYALDAGYAVHRIPDFPKVRSLRSGPSWGKVVLDARCVFEIRRLAKRQRPDAIVAHHIEAALAALVAQVAPVHYVAHTALEHELPLYFPFLPARLVAELGARAERLVCRASAGVGAVAPSLSRMLDGGATYLPVPWLPEDTEAPSQEACRRALGVCGDARLCLYAGNLDRYQGWERLIEALAVLRRSQPDARLLIATESDAAPARAEAARYGVADAIDVRRLDGESARRLVHAGSDLAWVPRLSPGGLPIKMLDAFARGLPVVAMARATADLPIGDACIQVADDDPIALAKGARRVFASGAEVLREEARRYLVERHSIAAFDGALARLLGEAPARRHRGMSTFAPTRAFLDPE